MINIMEIKVLGACCTKCKTTHSLIEKVIKNNNLDVQLTKVTDMVEIMSYDLMSLPAIVIDGEIKVKGRVPSESEIREILGL